MSVSLTFSSVTRPVLDAVLTECAKQRDEIGVNLAAGPAFAPQVHCGGSDNGVMLYTINTPNLSSRGALAVMIAADEAARDAVRWPVDTLTLVEHDRDLDLVPFLATCGVAAANVGPV